MPLTGLKNGFYGGGFLPIYQYAAPDGAGRKIQKAQGKRLKFGLSRRCRHPGPNRLVGRRRRPRRGAPYVLLHGFRISDFGDSDFLFAPIRSHFEGLALPAHALWHLNGLELGRLLCLGLVYASLSFVSRLTKQEQWVLCVVLALLLVGWAVKAFRTAHPQQTTVLPTTL
jgi:hypothetical protein